jgi:excisionase family DNA binding protein
MTSHSLTPADDNVATLEALLTINDVARLLVVSRAKVYELMSVGALVPIRVGERARFDPVDIRAYLERQREASP